MDVLLTGAYGRCGTALIDHLEDAYDWTYLNRSDRPTDHPYGGYDTIVADVADRDTLIGAASGHDAMVHMAAYPYTDGDFETVLEPNIIGMYNALEAARRGEHERFVFISSNHAVGMYELEHAPAVYAPSHDLTVDHTDPVRPDSFYGATKCFGEALGRYYTECHEYPRRFYSLRVGTVNGTQYDHPYGDAEHGVDSGEFDRDSDQYQRAVARMKALWQSRRDFAHQVDCCLRDETVSFDVFYGVSDNAGRWLDIDHAREVIGYDPQDGGHRWDGPPTDG
ncbi:NAD-dependent epimerase/dehydratase family protein [Halocatena halophila]|uniref:NAD-dependent epimerase/dehydratase family protein n=1 Tax=Halocatena halophila TaxID=2814576 RepID=UPI002ED27F73